jgi:hypothetical protein
MFHLIMFMAPSLFPGRVNRMMYNSGFDEYELLSRAAGFFVRLMRMSMICNRSHLVPGIIGRTAEYSAVGHFHNSQITVIDHRKETVSFRYKNMLIV